PRTSRSGRRRRRSATGASALSTAVDSSTCRVSANALGLLAVDRLEAGVVDLFGEAVEDELAPVEGDGPVGVAVYEIQVVQRAHHGDPVLCVDALEVLHDRVG